jgi:homogentisate 1,2-dioxygenase
MHYGFGNIHTSEAIQGAIPDKQHSPQRCPFNLYAEQISGSAFTRKRNQNLHTWVYRCWPSVGFQGYEIYPFHGKMTTAVLQKPDPIRLLPKRNELNTTIDFIDSWQPIASNHHANTYWYYTNQSMNKRYFINRDAEMLFIPVSGNLNIHSEMGTLPLSPKMIAVIPRGIAIQIELLSPLAYGYLCENKGLPFTLPELGTIGANGLANPRHFAYPTASFDIDTKHVILITKYQEHLFSTHTEHSPFNIVGWVGNYAPYSYDLTLFNTINTVSFDHPDPSIFTVLTTESDVPGMSAIDFVIFPPRYMVAENTFRPPYFHRNIMSEFMGLIEGKYDAKNEGFLPGGVSIHNGFTPHGPDYDTFKLARDVILKPEKYDNTLAFMLESCSNWNHIDHIEVLSEFDIHYANAWKGFHFEIPH